VVAGHGPDRKPFVATRRNVVERFFNRMKSRRALASRYDKKALIYRGGVMLAAIIDWLS
jgi:transposase